MYKKKIRMSRALKCEKNKIKILKARKGAISSSRKNYK